MSEEPELLKDDDDPMDKLLNIINKAPAIANAETNPIVNPPSNIEDIELEDRERREALQNLRNKYSNVIKIAKISIMRNTELTEEQKIEACEELTHLKRQDGYLYTFVSKVNLSTILMFIFFILQAFGGY